MIEKDKYLEMITGLIKRPAMYTSSDIGGEFFLSGFEFAVSMMNSGEQTEGGMSFLEFCNEKIGPGMRNFRQRFEHEHDCHISFVGNKQVKSSGESKELEELYSKELSNMLALYLEYMTGADQDVPDNSL